MEILFIVVVPVVVLFVVASLVVGLVVELLWWAIIELVLGVLARAILPLRGEHRGRVAAGPPFVRRRRGLPHRFTPRGAAT